MKNYNMGITDIRVLENWLWEAACKIRGEVDAPKYKDYILPLIFIKRLSDVFEDELQYQAEEFGDREVAEQIIEEDPSIVRVYLPKQARWEHLSKLSTNIGEALTDAVRDIARHNEKLSGVIDTVDFNATTAGQRVISDEQLKALMQVLNKYRLGLKDVEPDILGRAYEYLLRKFAEGSGQSAGEFYTPKEVAILMAHVLDPEPGMSVYDPCTGSSGLLIKCSLRFKEKYGNDSSLAPVEFYGQEYQPATYALSRMNLFLHDMGESKIKLGDSMKRPAFTRESNVRYAEGVPRSELSKSSDTSLMKFDLVTANPMWNQKFDQMIYENDPYGRFSFGFAPSNTADWAWIQHMYHSLKEKGKMAVVLDTGAVSRGSGNAGKNRERDIRKEFIDRDLVEAVILLPENLFYNTTAPGVILIMNKDKKHKREILLINAAKHFEKGRPKNFLTEDNIKDVADLYLNWQEQEGISKVIATEEATQNDYNISPSRYVQQNGNEEVLPLEDAVVLLRESEEEKQESDSNLNKILKELGV